MIHQSAAGIGEGLQTRGRFAQLPGILRRPLWWIAFNVGRQRANYFGTFVVSTVSHLGTDAIHPLSLTPNFLTYGMIGTDGRVPLRIIFDHRVFDGVVVARVLARMEALLNGPILEELRALAGNEKLTCRKRKRRNQAVARAGAAVPPVS